MTRGDREAAGQKLAHNEWAASLRRLSNDSGTVLTECSAGKLQAPPYASRDVLELCFSAHAVAGLSCPLCRTLSSWIVRDPDGWKFIFPWVQA